MSNTSTFTLDKKTKAEWIKRLRSGEYNQATGALYDSSASIGFDGESTGSGYCCLGVLCEIEGATQYEMNGLGLPHEIGIGEELTLEEFVDIVSISTARRRGWNYEVPAEMNYAIKTPKYGWVSLADLNDEKRLTFSQIADLVEKYVETH